MRTTKQSGARSEMIACHWLLTSGHEVFRNVSHWGDIDIVAFKAGVFTLFDVKTLPERHINRSLKPSQVDLNVKILAVDPVTCKCRIIEPLRIALTAECEECGKTFGRKRLVKRFCSMPCRGINARRRRAAQPLQRVVPMEPASPPASVSAALGPPQVDWSGLPQGSAT